MTHHFVGTVQSGTGRGAKFIALPIYANIFESYLGKPPFFGTLNLKLNDTAAAIVNKAFRQGKVFDNLEYEGKEYGGIVVIKVSIALNGKSIDAVAVRPHLTEHEGNIVELVSDKNLRQTLELQDGDTVKFNLRD